jgi:hypothetical protein
MGRCSAYYASHAGAAWGTESFNPCIFTAAGDGVAISLGGLVGQGAANVRGYVVQCWQDASVCG